MTLEASTGEIVKNANGTWSWSFDTIDGPDQSQIVTVTATDSDSAQSQSTFELTVNNVAPVVTVLEAPAEIVLGGTAEFAGAFEDPGLDAWRGEAAIVRMGVPVAVVPVTVNSDGTFAFDYQFAAAGSHSVTVTVFDDESGTPTPLVSTVYVFLPGDYDRNGSVEQADYDYWKQHFGDTVGLGLQADGNGDGSVDTADYTVWRNHLGEIVSGPGAGSAASSLADQTASPNATTIRPIAATSTSVSQLASVPVQLFDGRYLSTSHAALPVRAMHNSARFGVRNPANRAYEIAHEHLYLLLCRAEHDQYDERSESLEFLRGRYQPVASANEAFQHVFDDFERQCKVKCAGPK